MTSTPSTSFLVVEVMVGSVVAEVVMLLMLFI